MAYFVNILRKKVGNTLPTLEYLCSRTTIPTKYMSTREFTTPLWGKPPLHARNVLFFAQRGAFSFSSVDIRSDSSKTHVRLGNSSAEKSRLGLFNTVYNPWIFAVNFFRSVDANT